jgi:transposase
MTLTTQTDSTTKPRELYIAFELSGKSWKLASSDGRPKPRFKTVDARALDQVFAEVQRAKQRFHLDPKVPVRTCYEAGRDGFWLHRALGECGIQNVVVDSASIEVNRRARRAKTDRLDARKLLTMLMRYQAGERDVWRTVRVPTASQEDARIPHRELGRMKQERTRLRNRARALLVAHGIRPERLTACLKQIERVRMWNNKPLPTHIRNELQRLFARLELVATQIKDFEAERQKAIKTGTDDCSRKARTLQMLKGIGWKSSSLLVYEFFGWRKFRNRKQVASLAGLTGTPYASGGSRREQGISKAGNKRVRTTMIELSWLWLRYQPQSAFSRWFNERYGSASSRIRRSGVVALARKLLIGLWRFLEHGVVPEGAILKVA